MIISVKKQKLVTQSAMFKRPCAVALAVLLGLSGCGEEPSGNGGPDAAISFGDTWQVKSDVKTADTKTQDAKDGQTADTGSDGGLLDVADTTGSDSGVADTKDTTVSDTPDSKDTSLLDVAKDTGPDVQPDIGKDTGKDTGKDIANCTPKPETCNELDDDCNGLTDESCDDGEACTENDACNFTSCYGTFKKCTDDDKCTADTCDAGTCTFVAYTCKDNQPCTLDTCDPATGCKYVGTTDACDDGNSCTSGDSCATGSCAGTAIPCDDGNPCTTDSCDKTIGCKFDNNTAACDDGNGCTTVDVCQNGSCVGGGGACDDGNSCTTDSCDGGTCGHAPLTATGCEDGNACTSGDTCQDGTCVAAPVVCDDGITCTNDSCSNGQCVYQGNCQAGYTCDGATNACVIAGCALPADACADGAQSRNGCGSARVIGRSKAKVGFKVSDDTCWGYNYGSDDSKCYDGGYDHTYRIFLRKAEKIEVKLWNDWYCIGGATGASGKLRIAAAPRLVLCRRGC
jgi:hypothetical protein